MEILWSLSILTPENAFSQKVELQVGSRSIIRKSEKEIEYKEKFTLIADISADMNDVNVCGRVLDIGEIRTFEKEMGPPEESEISLLGIPQEKSG